MLLSQASTMQGSALRSQLCSPRFNVARPVGRVFAPVQAKANNRVQQRQDRHRRLRKKLSGTTERPRLAVYRSNNHIYAQVIDDTVGHTLVAANSLMKDLKEVVGDNTANKDGAAAIGKKIAELCAAKGIKNVAFDRGGNAFHGRVKAVAEAAREAGLQF